MGYNLTNQLSHDACFCMKLGSAKITLSNGKTIIKQFYWGAAARCIGHALARRTTMYCRGEPTPRTTNKIQQIQNILQQENKFIPSHAPLCLLQLPCHQFQRAINPHLTSPCSTQYILTSSVRIIAVHIWSQDPAQKQTSKHPKHPRENALVKPFYSESSSSPVFFPEAAIGTIVVPARIKSTHSIIQPVICF